MNREALTQALQAVIQEFNNQVQTTAGLPMIEQSITETTRQIQPGCRPTRPRPGRFRVPCAESMQSYHQQLTSEAVEDHRDSEPRPRGRYLRRAVEDAGKHVVALDRALEEGLTRSIESLGGHCAQ